MGLFSRWTNKEGASAEAPVEAPKAEATETKSAAETGRERVKSIREYMRKTWDKWTGKAVNGGKWLLDSAASLGYTAIGGMEKGTKATGRGIESGYKATMEYGSESKAEAGQLIDAGIDSLNEWAQQRVDDYEAGKEFVGAAFEVGVDTLNGWAEKKVAQYEAFKKNVENAPADAARRWEGLKKEVIGAISERYTAAREGAKKDYARACADVSAKRDSFTGWFNQKRMELAGTAELRGQVAELKETVERQNRLIEQLLRLQGVSAEGPVLEAGDEEGEGAVTEAGA